MHLPNHPWWVHINVLKPPAVSGLNILVAAHWPKQHAQPSILTRHPHNPAVTQRTVRRFVYLQPAS
ncbi:hypothetical protein L484_015237 [Morus notabilis]|uniref:Uncharacterized protein n=1 Tax=Morus notabilis TaxID=981085 RepID=W9RUT5_9ROSA|nr:hypothetical protein L484_015237 [Morus notabilis]